MKMDTIKRLPRWAQVAGILTVAYVAFFDLPSLWATLRWIWATARWGSSPDVFLTGIVQFILEIAGTAIWIASVYLCCRVLLFTTKKAYAFLLAYLLVCTVIDPLRYGIKQLQHANQERQMQEMSADRQEQVAEIPMQKPVVVGPRINLSLPIGPVLLLLAIWFMCKAEGIELTKKSLNRTDDPPIGSSAG